VYDITYCVAYIICYIVFIAREAKRINKFYYFMLYNILYFSVKCNTVI